MTSRRLWQVVSLIGVLTVHGSLAATSPKFYPDDPLTSEPTPYPTYSPEARALSEILELVGNTLTKPGERHPSSGVIPAGGVNTLGEVLDGPWFVNRHATRRLPSEALIRGPEVGRAPLQESAWQVLTVKPYGFRPGILIADARQQRYLLMFDGRDSPEASTGAQVVSSHILHAIGYHVPDSYIVTFAREKLVLAEGAEIISSAGNKRTLTTQDVDAFLQQVARTGPDHYRAVAIHASPADAVSALGPYQLYATRRDDPNDIVPHEHRRDLRGLFVIASWIDLATTRAISTMDILVDDGTVPPHVRHYLVELLSSLGAGIDGPKEAWDGNDPLFDADAALKNIVGFGIWSPKWMRASYPRTRGVGRFESKAFDPQRWTPIERLAPFENRLPDDDFWGAKQVTAFTDEDIRALVSTGEYSDPAAAEWIARCLIERRDKIGRYYFSTVLPLDAFRIENRRLAFDDLGERYGVPRIKRTYTAHWLRLANDTGALTPVQAADSFQLPEEIDRADPGSYYGVRIEAVGEHPDRNITVYLRSGSAGHHQVVGVERGWPGKTLADPNRDVSVGARRFGSLTAEQQRLYAPYATADAEARGRHMSVEDHFEAQAISERTTYDAVTHALLNSRLTDAQGHSLGRAFDLVTVLERVAGQYYGRGGDQQFRLYVDLKPDAFETLGRSVEFFMDHENTVYHVGYPHSFRQVGREPNLQFSVSEDHLKADIDVDYRSSRMPRALFNGHLTAANSDVRAGDNVDRHDGRWAGMIAWWRAMFGSLPEGQEGPQDALAEGEAAEVPTPLPPDRPTGTPIARLEDAVQEFLTDWLVRRKIDEALSFVSGHPSACINVDDDAKNESLDGGRARAALRETMEYAVDHLNKPHNLTEAIHAVVPLANDRRLMSHAFAREFSLHELSAYEASQYFCAPLHGNELNRVYYGALFRFKAVDGGALGLLWVREESDWKLVSFEVFDI